MPNLPAKNPTPERKKPQTPEEKMFERLQAELTALEQKLFEQELDLATLLAELAAFEKRYVETVGRRYALLDQLEAEIAEAIARRNPQDQAAQQRAKEARAKADESANSVRDTEESTRRSRADQSPSLKDCYREAAKQLHPDLALDPEQKAIRERLMAEINRAYAEGDEERIRQILADWQNSPDNVEGAGAGADLVRISRKIAQVEARLEAIPEEIERIRASEIWEMKAKVDEADGLGLDLLADLGAGLDQQIAEAQARLADVK